MEVTHELIDKLAHLARLEFNETEKQEIRRDLERMIGFVEKINELPLDEIEPLLHLCEEVNVLREDVPQNEMTREEALANAPAHNGVFFLAPCSFKNNSRNENP
ncbi:MAG: Asp-tRNA(Asn)/Glu-tRNA(Gln) amidotransferase subunit GatC [Chitinophagaceae bacterium]|nr:Asp-tRNA(Asn)/Glu-tRNA(Gln) amidotransferase subunit GatC [Chitinophagaceae bacterium]